MDSNLYCWYSWDSHEIRIIRIPIWRDLNAPFDKGLTHAQRKAEPGLSFLKNGVLIQA